MSYKKVNAIALSERVKKAIQSPESKKVLATVSRDGVPHAAFKGSLRVSDDGLLEYYELIESSQTNKNMVYSLWFGKTVTVNVLDGDESFLIEGVVDRALIAGGEFEKHYAAVDALLGTDLSTVWRIIPQREQEESFVVRRDAELAAHPILQHLDRVTVPQPAQ